jgi:hypothetical protein
MDFDLVEVAKTANRFFGFSAVENTALSGYWKRISKAFMITFTMTGCRTIFPWTDTSRSNSRRQGSWRRINCMKRPKGCPKVGPFPP